MLLRVFAHALTAALALVVALLLQTGAASAKWLRAESPNFIVYGDTSERVLRKKIESLETFDAALRLITRTEAPPSPNKLKVYLLAEEQLNDVRPGLHGSIAGFYVARLDEIAAFSSPGEQDWLSSKVILQHEYIHHFMLQYFPAAYPAWFVEGFAEYFSTMTFEDGELKWGMFENARAYTLVTTSWTPMEKVLSGKIKSRDQTYDLYAQGWLAVHYFYSKPELQTKLEGYIASIVKGENDLAAAFQSNTGMTFAQFDSELRKYMRGRLFARGVKGWAPPQQAYSVRPLAAGEAATLLLRARTMAGMSERDQEKTLKAARKLAVEMPDDPHVRLTLARAEIEFGDPQAAVSLLAAAEQTAEMQYLRGRALQAQAKADEAETSRTGLLKQAKAAFARAHKLDGNHVGALYYYGSIVAELEPMSENTVNIFLRAHELSPQLADTSLAAAGALVHMGEFAAATDLLEPLAHRPHSGEAGAYASYLLEAARSQNTLPMSYAQWRRKQAAAAEASASSTEG